MEYNEIVRTLGKPRERLAGLKQVVRALECGKAKAVVLADDADDHIQRRVRSLCQERGVACHVGPAMAELGQMCRLNVGAAVACVLNQETESQPPKG